MEHITIDSDRSVTVPVDLRKIGVQYDHNVNTIEFVGPRYSGNVDLSTMAIYINYILSDKSPGKYKADNVTVCEEDDTLIRFDWTITRNVTQVSGVLSCLVCAKKTDEEGNEVNHWNTEIFRLLSVSEGMENDQVIQDQYPDVITSLFQKIEEHDTKLLEFSGLSTIVSDLEDSVDALKEDLNELKEQGIGGGSGATNAQKSTLVDLVEFILFSDGNVLDKWNAFKSAWGGDNTPTDPDDDPVVPDVPSGDKAVSVSWTGTTASISNLKNLTVSYSGTVATIGV